MISWFLLIFWDWEQKMKNYLNKGTFKGIKSELSEMYGVDMFTYMNAFIKACFAEGNTIETRMIS